MNFYRMRSNAIAPTRATKGSACYDLYACIDHPITLGPNSKYAIPTGIILEIPEGHVVKVYARSSVGFKRDLVLCNSVGIIDHDYRNELMLLFRNVGYNPVTIEDGERLAQMMLEKVLSYEMIEVTEQPKMVESRSGGIGSTGVR